MHFTLTPRTIDSETAAHLQLSIGEECMPNGRLLRLAQRVVRAAADGKCVLPSDSDLLAGRSASVTVAFRDEPLNEQGTSLSSWKPRAVLLHLRRWPRCVPVEPGQAGRSPHQRKVLCCAFLPHRVGQ